MKIQFCGAAREVTGSSHLITLDNGYKILLDCGLYQGHDDKMEKFNSHWIYNPKEIDCMILSHAHIDHCGRIPMLVRDGFEENIFCTHATRSLTSIMLLDSALIQERDAEYENKRLRTAGKKQTAEPLYTSKDVDIAMNRFVAYNYNRWFRISDNVEVFFTDAGHILGSATVTLRINENGNITMLGFTGDIGRPDRPILRNPVPMPAADYLICESTYGDRDHLSAPNESAKLLSIIKHTCVEKKGKVIIPAFSVGRTQELVYMLDRLEHEHSLPHINVYVDSPLAVNATQVFAMHPECFDEEVHRYMLTDTNPFGFNRLRYVKDVEVSKQLNHSEEPCVIISASGMANAGRIKHHLYNSVQNPRNTILIVGYAAPYTPAGELRSGANSISLFGENLQVLADVVIMDSFSAHADRNEIVAFIENHKKRLKRLFLVHGQYEAQQHFGEMLHGHGFHPVSIPALGEEEELS
ncbi:MAG: MBL fold metallo-hydrolase [Saprospiraceae bacterium]|nr:MBL fold metallo-hydrolase [Saprospiraceae bacterium]MBP7679907.1 MBL fold metallo-hydrolase [Saprospiraceae bacterium]